MNTCITDKWERQYVEMLTGCSRQYDDMQTRCNPAHNELGQIRCPLFSDHGNGCDPGSLHWSLLDIHYSCRYLDIYYFHLISRYLNIYYSFKICRYLLRTLEDHLLCRGLLFLLAGGLLLLPPGGRGQVPQRPREAVLVPHDGQQRAQHRNLQIFLMYWNIFWQPSHLELLGPQLLAAVLQPGQVLHQALHRVSPNPGH